MMTEADRLRIHTELDALLERLQGPRKARGARPPAPVAQRPRSAPGAVRAPNLPLLRAILRRLAEIPELQEPARSFVWLARRAAGDATIGEEPPG